ncbi:hypothetical protein I316_05340 [Kwoniella heveanensis BCC8398]|uniref:Phosphatidylinositol glycan, class U n=1 Tax=Kwoniella heveanensis BCC8398 TaxID=1296120 RepID=A0A1B9GPL6_9TREE|nr:hypothetical protein I316_05340 [Kwoniella heveanensis BCC8398]
MDGIRIPPILKSHAGVLAAGTVLRLALFITAPALCDVLQRRPELSTPLTSFRSLKEGVFIYERDTNPYEGGVFYHSPLHLAFFTYLVPISSSLLTVFLWAAGDILGSLGLVNIWSQRRRTMGGQTDRSAIVTALYLFNPYTLLTCLARSTTALDNALLIHAISSAASGKPGRLLSATVLLAISTHTSFYPILLLPAFAIIFSQLRPLTSSTTSAAVTVSGFALSSVGLAGLAYGLAGDAWVAQTFGTIINVWDLTPNVGMWWYFFTEMFDHFRSFFLGVFQLHHLIYVAPLCLRLSDDPLVSMLVMVGVISTWKSYPALGDMALWAGLLSCFPEIVSNLRHPLFTLTVHLYTSILLPLLHSLWLLTGTGNANFFYAATMVYGLNASLAVVDVLGAGLRLQVKRETTKALSLLDDVAGREPDFKVIDEIWDKKGWSVVQFTGQLE